jgi:hypothetical protein
MPKPPYPCMSTPFTFAMPLCHKCVPPFHYNVTDIEKSIPLGHLFYVYLGKFLKCNGLLNRLIDGRRSAACDKSCVSSNLQCLYICFALAISLVGNCIYSIGSGKLFLNTNVLASSSVLYAPSKQGVTTYQYILCDCLTICRCLCSYPMLHRLNRLG